MGERRDEDSDDLVANELVDDAVMSHEDVCGDVIEAVEKGPECRWRDPVDDGRGAPDIGEQEGRVDLRAAVVPIEEPEAGAAVVRVLRPRCSTAEAHQHGDRAAEWRGAHLATRRPGKALQTPAISGIDRIRSVEDGPPHRLVRVRTQIRNTIRGTMV